VLVVTDSGLVRAGVIEPALVSLHGAGVAVEVYDKVVADPPEAV
jgi:alcohol dehydrogenase class IV